MKRYKSLFRESNRLSKGIQEFLDKYLSRKPFDFSDIGYDNRIKVVNLPKAVMDFINTIPQKNPDDLWPNAYNNNYKFANNFEIPVTEHYFVLLDTKNRRRFLVSTEGYKYARYVLELV